MPPLALLDNALDLPVWTIAPFALLLVTIAVLPLAAPHWWHSNRNRLIVSLGFAVPVAVYLVGLQLATGMDTIHPLLHELRQYLSFILLLGSLYVVSGGIVVGGDLEGRPLTNAAFLCVGAVLANIIGTTGASVLLIRPLLRSNRQRSNTRHLPVFFIFIVSNLGGLLTPLGDPPLFLGFLNGVPFYWTLTLWREWLLVNGLVLAIFLVWDNIAFHRESAEAHARAMREYEPLSFKGSVNVPLLVGVMVGVLMQKLIPAPYGEWVGIFIMAIMAGLSLKLTPSELRAANGFTWGPILEVAILFLGIFVTMVPALQILEKHREEFGLTEPWQYFWLTGGLSACLDNAPTYMTFVTLAAGETEHIGKLVTTAPHLLEAISCGAVFMGALTYIGNGPNFMVKAIAEEAGFRTPSFFGYMAYSCVVLLPVFGVVTVVFFR
ncbi:MAG TPA: sodium:proton antiporter [Gemmataceae bacterium]|nr:sodium:proton antiporter [Gemmataceae bacterium]